MSENQEWLKPYAVFCALAEIFQTTEHWLWGHLAKCDDKLIKKLTDPETSPIYSEGVHFVYYLQWRLHMQLKEASTYLKQFGIARTAYCFDGFQVKKQDVPDVDYFLNKINDNTYVTFEIKQFANPLSSTYMKEKNYFDENEFYMISDEKERRKYFERYYFKIS